MARKSGMSRDLYSQVSVLHIRHFHSCGVGEAAATAFVGDGEEDGEDVVKRRLSLATAAWEPRASDQGRKTRKESSTTLNSSPFSLKAVEFLCLLAPCQPLDSTISPFHPQNSLFPSQPKRVNLLFPSLGHCNIARLTPVRSRGKNPTNQASYIETQCFVILFVYASPPSSFLNSFFLNLMA